MTFRLDRLVLSEWLKMLMLFLLVKMGLFLVADIQNRMDKLIASGATAREIMGYYLILTPTFLPTVLPLAVLISLLASLGIMHRRLEIVAMRNAGLSLLRITRSVWLVGGGLCVLLFYLNAHFVPWSKEASREMLDQFRFRGELQADKSAEEVGLVHNLTFNNAEEGRRWFLNRFSEYDYTGYGVTISILDKAGRESTRLLANRGYYNDTVGHWVLLNGREVTFDPESGDAIRNLGFDERSSPELTEDPVLMQYLRKKPQDLSFWQLGRVRDALERSNNPTAHKYALRLYRILVNPLDVLIAIALAVHFAIGPIRANPLMGIVKAVGLYLVYFLATQVFGVLSGERVPAFAAALAPSLLMLLGSCLLLTRTARPR
jgi:lipopolysaccharide export system permease protein